MDHKTLIDIELIYFVLGSIGIVVWWYFRYSIRIRNSERAELIDAIKELREAIKELSHAQNQTNTKLEKLQSEHNIFKGSCKYFKNYVPEGE